MKFAAMMLSAALLVSGCEIVGLDGGFKYDLYVASVTTNCMMFIEARCLLIKHSPDAEWELHPGIEGFAHESGYEYRIRVHETTLKDPPQDGSSLRYQLLDVMMKLPRVAPERDFSWGQTDSSVYTLVHSGPLYHSHAQLTYTNKSTSSIYYARCEPEDPTPVYYIFREPPDTTPSFISAVRGCVGGVPTGTIAPGASIKIEVDFLSGESPNAIPPITMAKRTGLFRIYLRLCREPTTNSDNCKDQIKMLQQSNAFRILPPAT